MLKAKVTVKDQSQQMFQSLADLTKAEVLVGIPEQYAGRSGKITNAQLCYIHTHGVRSKNMRQEMAQAMIGSNGLPHTLDYDRLMDNLDKGMPYSQALSLYTKQHGKADWRIPPRPIIEPAIRDPQNAKILAEDLAKAAGLALDGNLSGAENALKRAGMDAQNLCRNWFVNPKNHWPPNADSTVNGWMSPWGKFFKGKGSSKPLIATGQLRRAITYVIRKKQGTENLAIGKQMAKGKSTQDFTYKAGK